LTADEIVAAMPRVRNVKELRELTRACTTCFGCEADLDDLVAAHEDLFGTRI
jgi:NAD(P)H-nitrite reductase large subunit